MPVTVFTEEHVTVPYFTVAEARVLKPLDNATDYPDAAIEAMRATVEQAIEQRTGVAFVPRTATEVVDGNGGRDIMLRFPRPLSVTSATVDDTALTVSDLILYRDGRIRYPSYWTRGDGNVEITYTHGHATVPGEVKQAALMLTKHWLVQGPIDDRMTSMSTDDGTFSLATPGLRGSSFGIPFVDAVVQTYSLQVAVA